MIVLVLVSLIQHYSLRLHLSQCFYCVKTENVLKTRVERELKRLSALNAFKRI